MHACREAEGGGTLVSVPPDPLRSKGDLNVLDDDLPALVEEAAHLAAAREKTCLLYTSRCV